jgi:putative ATP-dependent endonuclease of OLD family
MHIKEIVIENYKGFYGVFRLPFNNGLNVLVGDNESGKSTILESIQLALQGAIGGKYFWNELSQYYFNVRLVNEYLISIKEGKAVKPPHIRIEIHFDDEGGGADAAGLLGSNNINRESACGVSIAVEFEEKYKPEYEKLIESRNVKTIPIEYYHVIWKSFSDNAITSKSIPVKCAMIDSSSYRYQNGSDIYIRKIIHDHLEINEIVDIAQAYRRTKEAFMGESAVHAVNAKIQAAAKISDKIVSLSVDLATKNAWEESLITYLDEIPFQYIGKGEQCLVKTKLAMSHKKSTQAHVILLEEPENHLSHSRLNQLVGEISVNSSGKQVIVSTHSSFVANKLGIDKLILLSDKKTTRIIDLSVETKEYFSKLAGYDTLRMILCKKAILVEGDSDELVVQAAYRAKNGGKLPIEAGIEVVSVGTSFLRFLEVAAKINKPIRVVTDNDGNIERIQKKYEKYTTDKLRDKIKICYDSKVVKEDKLDGVDFNFNTLEPVMLEINGLASMNTILNTKYANINDMHRYMKANKTECALGIFEYVGEVIYPQYILDALS